EQLRRKLAQWEASWPGKSQRIPLQFAGLPPVEGMRAVVIHKPDATQAQTRMVSPGLPRSTPRYAEAVVTNTALGGGFTSVRVDATRVGGGLAYSVHARLQMTGGAGLRVFSSSTKNEPRREVVARAREKRRASAQPGPGGAAGEKARRYLAGLFPLGLESH